MIAHKDTLKHAESLIQNRIDEVLLEISKWSRECADHNEEFISFKQSRSEELKLLYKRLENIQQMRTSYRSGRKKLTNEELRVKVIKAALLLVAMILLVVPEPSGATKYISGFLVGVIAR